MPFKLGTTELIIILVIVLLLFGASRLPKLAGSMGKSIKEFRKGARGEGEEEEKGEGSGGKEKEESTKKA